jgi:hypothetical protein
VRYTEHLALEGIAASIGTIGDAYDNCLMESIIGLFKSECIKVGPFHDGPLRNLTDVEMATMAWVDWWNHRRLHSSIGMLTPTEAEAAHYAATTALQPEPVRAHRERGSPVEVTSPCRALVQGSGPTRPSPSAPGCGSREAREPGGDSRLDPTNRAPSPRSSGVPVPFGQAGTARRDRS